MSDDQLYYVQDIRKGYVGNCVLWWGKNSVGYTCNLAEAGKYKKSDNTWRSTDILWPVEHVDKAARVHVDVQGLDREMPEVKEQLDKFYEERRQEQLRLARQTYDGRERVNCSGCGQFFYTANDNQGECDYCEFERKGLYG